MHGLYVLQHFVCYGTTNVLVARQKSVVDIWRITVVCMLLACCYDKLTTNVLCFSHDDSSSPISYPLHGFRSSTHFPSVYPWLRNIDGKHSSRKSLLLCADGVEVEAAYTFANRRISSCFFIWSAPAEK